MAITKHFQVLGFLGALTLAGGCAAVGQQSPADDVKAFFLAAHEANFLGVQCFSTKNLDLSGYSHLIGVKYPPTQSVDILNGPPSRPYQAFAVLEAQDPYSSSETYDAKVLAGFTSKAKAIGADAIIICGASGQAAPPLLQKSSKLAAVAVKYRLETGPELGKRP